MIMRAHHHHLTNNNNKRRPSTGSDGLHRPPCCSIRITTILLFLLLLGETESSRALRANQQHPAATTTTTTNLLNRTAAAADDDKNDLQRSLQSCNAELGAAQECLGDASIISSEQSAACGGCIGRETNNVNVEEDLEAQGCNAAQTFWCDIFTWKCWDCTPCADLFLAYQDCDMANRGVDCPALQCTPVPAPTIAPTILGQTPAPTSVPVVTPILQGPVECTDEMDTALACLQDTIPVGDQAACANCLIQNGNDMGSLEGSGGCDGISAFWCGIFQTTCTECEPCAALFLQFQDCKLRVEEGLDCAAIDCPPIPAPVVQPEDGGEDSIDDNPFNENEESIAPSIEISDDSLPCQDANQKAQDCFMQNLDVDQVLNCTSCIADSMNDDQFASNLFGGGCDAISLEICGLFENCPCGACSDVLIEQTKCELVAVGVIGGGGGENNGSGASVLCDIDCRITAPPTQTPEPTVMPATGAPSRTFLPTQTGGHCADKVNALTTCFNETMGENDAINCFQCFEQRAETVITGNIGGGGCDGLTQAMCELLVECNCDPCIDAVVDNTNCHLQEVAEIPFECTMACNAPPLDDDSQSLVPSLVQDDDDVASDACIEQEQATQSCFANNMSVDGINLCLDCVSETFTEDFISSLFGGCNEISLSLCGMFYETCLCDPCSDQLLEQTKCDLKERGLLGSDVCEVDCSATAEPSATPEPTPMPVTGPPSLTLMPTLVGGKCAESQSAAMECLNETTDGQDCVLCVEAQMEAKLIGGIASGCQGLSDGICQLYKDCDCHECIPEMVDLSNCDLQSAMAELGGFECTLECNVDESLGPSAAFSMGPSEGPGGEASEGPAQSLGPSAAFSLVPSAEFSETPADSSSQAPAAASSSQSPSGDAAPVPTPAPAFDVPTIPPAPTVAPAPVVLQCGDVLSACLDTGMPADDAMACADCLESEVQDDDLIKGLVQGECQGVEDVWCGALQDDVCGQFCGDCQQEVLTVHTCKMKERDLDCPAMSCPAPPTAGAPTPSPITTIVLETKPPAPAEKRCDVAEQRMQACQANEMTEEGVAACEICVQDTYDNFYKEDELEAEGCDAIKEFWCFALLDRGCDAFCEPCADPYLELQLCLRNQAILDSPEYQEDPVAAAAKFCPTTKTCAGTDDDDDDHLFKFEEEEPSASPVEESGPTPLPAESFYSPDCSTELDQMTACEDFGGSATKESCDFCMDGRDASFLGSCAAMRESWCNAYEVVCGEECDPCIAPRYHYRMCTLLLQAGETCTEDMSCDATDAPIVAPTPATEVGPPTFSPAPVSASATTAPSFPPASLVRYSPDCSVERADISTCEIEGGGDSTGCSDCLNEAASKYEPPEPGVCDSTRDFSCNVLYKECDVQCSPCLEQRFHWSMCLLLQSTSTQCPDMSCTDVAQGPTLLPKIQHEPTSVPTTMLPTTAGPTVSPVPTPTFRYSPDCGVERDAVGSCQQVKGGDDTVCSDCLTAAGAADTAPAAGDCQATRDFSCFVLYDQCTVECGPCLEERFHWSMCILLEGAECPKQTCQAEPTVVPAPSNTVAPTVVPVAAPNVPPTMSPAPSTRFRYSPDCSVERQEIQSCQEAEGSGDDAVCTACLTTAGQGVAAPEAGNCQATRDFSCFVLYEECTAECGPCLEARFHWSMCMLLQGAECPKQTCQDEPTVVPAPSSTAAPTMPPGGPISNPAGVDGACRAADLGLLTCFQDNMSEEGYTNCLTCVGDSNADAQLAASLEADGASGGCNYLQGPMCSIAKDCQCDPCSNFLVSQTRCRLLTDGLLTESVAGESVCPIACEAVTGEPSFTAVPTQTPVAAPSASSGSEAPSAADTAVNPPPPVAQLTCEEKATVAENCYRDKIDTGSDCTDCLTAQYSQIFQSDAIIPPSGCDNVENAICDIFDSCWPCEPCRSELEQQLACSLQDTGELAPECPPQRDCRSTNEPSITTAPTPTPFARVATPAPVGVCDVPVQSCLQTNFLDPKNAESCQTCSQGRIQDEILNALLDENGKDCAGLIESLCQLLQDECFCQNCLSPFEQSIQCKLEQAVEEYGTPYECTFKCPSKAPTVTPSFVPTSSTQAPTFGPTRFTELPTLAPFSTVIIPPVPAPTAPTMDPTASLGTAAPTTCSSRVPTCLATKMTQEEADNCSTCVGDQLETEIMSSVLGGCPQVQANVCKLLEDCGCQRCIRAYETTVNCEITKVQDSLPFDCDFSCPDMPTPAPIVVDDDGGDRGGISLAAAPSPAPTAPPTIPNYCLERKVNLLACFSDAGLQGDDVVACTGCLGDSITPDFLTQVHSGSCNKIHNAICDFMYQDTCPCGPCTDTVLELTKCELYARELLDNETCQLDCNATLGPTVTSVPTPSPFTIPPAQEATAALQEAPETLGGGPEGACAQEFDSVQFCLNESTQLTQDQADSCLLCVEKSIQGVLMTAATQGTCDRMRTDTCQLFLDCGCEPCLGPFVTSTNCLLASYSEFLPFQCTVACPRAFDTPPGTTADDAPRTLSPAAWQIPSLEPTRASDTSSAIAVGATSYRPLQLAVAIAAMAGWIF